MPYKRKKGKSFVKPRKNKRYLTFKGVIYKSLLERSMAMCLHEQNIDFEYEPKTFTLMKSFAFPIVSFERPSNGKGKMKNTKGKRIQKIGYTPDFVGKDFVIETKGYANETFSMRWKLFKKWLVENGYASDNFAIYKPQSPSECKEVAKLIKERRKSFIVDLMNQDEKLGLYCNE